MGDYSKIKKKGLLQNRYKKVEMDIGRSVCGEDPGDNADLLKWDNHMKETSRIIVKSTIIRLVLLEIGISKFIPKML